MKATLLKALISALIAAGAGSAATAQAAQPFELVNEAKLDKVTMVDGHEKRALVEPDVVVPGDRLVFTTRYRNNTGQKVENIVVTNPIRPGIALAPDAAGALDVSVDGGKTWGKLAALKVADGQGGERPAASGDVTHVRWVLATVAPGASGALSFNAIVR